MSSIETFSDFGLAPEIVRAVSEHGYTTPTPIQKQAVPVVLAGRDVLAGAQTGTGKTAAFTLPMLHRLSVERGASARAIRALVLTPTRELAAQVAESITTYGTHLPLRSAVVFGGVSINPQIDLLRRGVDILVATPGRLLDHAGQKTVDLSRIEILILDEADRMLDMGFIHDLRRILALLPKKRQNLLFSATYSDEIRKLSAQFLSNPVEVEVARRNTAAETVTQVVHPVEKGHKRALLSHLIGTNNWRQVLVFTRTKHGANRLAEQLEKDGLTSAAIHGNKSQGARTRALADFKGGKVRVLVATDIAARGLDIDQLPHVVNYELPQVAEDYVHRIGRTGRAGSDGQAVSLVSGEERGLLSAIERLLGKRLPAQAVAGYDMKGEGDVEVERERPPQQRRRPAPPRGNSRAGAPAGASHGGNAQRSERPARGRRQDSRRP